MLEWAAQEERVLLSHDIETMVGYANERIALGLPMPGVIVARASMPVGRVVEDIITILGASEMSDGDNLVTFLPL